MRPISVIPPELLSEYSMNGEASISYRYRDDSSEEIQNQILSNYSKASFQKFYNKAKSRRTNYYGKTDKYLYDALSEYPIEGKDVIVFGSACPWYEIVAILHGAASCDVLEYSPRPQVHDKIRYCSEDDTGEYDVAFSISSFEHYGLGRYGDPINPNGDIAAMRKARSMLKDNGILFLSVPIGLDAVYFNVHRVYGHNRFPMLLEGFDLINDYGMDNNGFKRTDNTAKGTPYQPVFVLRKA